MKYFTREIVEGWQGDDGTKWMKLFLENEKKYQREFEKLKPRLNTRTFKFFTTVSLHDSEVVSIRILDRSSESRLLGKRRPRRRCPTDVSISILHFGEKGAHVYDLTYSRVRSMGIDLPSGTTGPARWAPMLDLGWWGWDELTAKGDDFLGHDILMNRGTILSLEFERINVRRRTVEAVKNSGEY
jgi:hypothetical protein